MLLTSSLVNHIIKPAGNCVDGRKITYKNVLYEMETFGL